MKDIQKRKAEIKTDLKSLQDDVTYLNTVLPAILEKLEMVENEKQAEAWQAMADKEFERLKIIRL